LASTITEEDALHKPHHRTISSINRHIKDAYFEQKEPRQSD